MSGELPESEIVPVQTPEQSIEVIEDTPAQEMVNRYIDQAERSIEAMQKIGSIMYNQQQQLDRQERVLEDLTKAIDSNTQASVSLKEVVEKETDTLKPVIKTILYAFLLAISALVILAGAKESFSFTNFFT